MSQSSVRYSGACLLLALAASFSTDAKAGEGVWTSNGPKGVVTALAIDPSSPATVYAGTTNDGIFKSTDAGGTWGVANAGLMSVTSLAVVPSTPSTLYAGTGWGTPSGLVGEVWKSTDSGVTWSATGLGNKAVSALVIDPWTPATLYAGTSAGVFKTTDAGETWVAANAGLTSLGVTSLAIDPAAPATVYAGTADAGVFKSTNSGGSWAGASNGLTPLPRSLEVSALAIDPATPATLYAATEHGVFKSTDSGATWTATPLIADGTLDGWGWWFTSLVVNSVNPSTLYVTPFGKGVYRSMDRGSTWSPFNVGLEQTVESLALDPSATTLYAGTSKGVWQTTLPPAATFLIPTSARVHGPNGAFYTTNVSLSNIGSAPLSFTMKFLGHDEDGSSGPEQTFGLEAGRSVTYFDALGSVFGQTLNYGAIRVTSTQTTLDVVSVTSTPAFGGTLSQTVPALRASELIPAGSRRSILYVREGDGFRSNLVLASNAGVPTTVDVELISPEGVTLAAKRYSVPPNGTAQIGRVVRDMGVLGAVTGARLVVSSSTEGAAFAALLFVIDEVTNGPVVIVAK